LLRSDGSASPDVTALLPKGAKVVSTTVAGERIAVVLDVGGGLEVRTFGLKTLRPAGPLKVATQPQPVRRTGRRLRPALALPGGGKSRALSKRRCPLPDPPPQAGEGRILRSLHRPPINAIPGRTRSLRLAV